MMEERGEWTFVLSRWVRWDGGRDVLFFVCKKSIELELFK